MLKSRLIAGAAVALLMDVPLMAATQGDAERRLRQMYHYCEIVECQEQSVPRRLDTLDIEGVIGLISRGPSSLQKASPQ